VADVGQRADRNVGDVGFEAVGASDGGGVSFAVEE